MLSRCLPSERRCDWAIGIALVVVTFLAYGQVAGHEFINFDDNVYVVDNPHVRAGLSWKGVVWALTEFHAGTYHPLTWLSHMIDCELWGLSAGAHALTNVSLHSLNGVLLYLFLVLATGRRGCAVVVAALFLWHPVQVEAVAWIASRKTVLSSVFWFAALVIYASHRRRHRRWKYVAVLGLYAMGLLAKPMVITLPAVLLLLDYWPFQSQSSTRDSGWPRTYLADKWPFVAIAIGSAVCTFLAQRDAGALSDLATVPLGTRIDNAWVSYVAYLGQLLWPARLGAFYPIEAPAVGLGVASLAVVVLLSTLAFRGRFARPWGFVGWFYYLITLLPVIGFVHFGGHAMADRFLYTPAVGVFVVAVWFGSEWIPSTRARLVVIGGIVAALCGATAIQVTHWRDSEAIFSHTLAVTDGDNFLAHTNLGVALGDRGDSAIAAEHYRAALRAHPRYPEAHNNLGRFYAERGEYAQAEFHFRQATESRQGFTVAEYNLGLVLARTGRSGEALAILRRVVVLDPNYADARLTLGDILERRGSFEEAAQHYGALTRLRSDSATAWARLSRALRCSGDSDSAAASRTRAAALDPSVVPMADRGCDQ